MEKGSSIAENLEESLSQELTDTYQKEIGSAYLTPNVSIYKTFLWKCGKGPQWAKPRT